MKIALCTGGTRGDVQPVLALALALIKAGHEVLLIGPPENKGWVESHGCPFAGLSINVEETLKDFSAAMTPLDLFKFMRILKKTPWLKQFASSNQIIHPRAEQFGPVRALL